MTLPELETYRQQLLALRGRLLGEAFDRCVGALPAAVLAGAAVDADPFPREWAVGLLENDGAILDEIDAALTRIDRGAFGLCAVCQAPLSPERLFALPHARHCVDCARRVEADAREDPARGAGLTPGTA
jgi:RNA polymerase-binding transcription factor DksA